MAHPKLTGVEFASPFELQNTNSLWRIKPPEMLVEGFLPAASLMGVTASPGVGKTWLMFELMRAACQAKPFLNAFQIPNKRSCLFVGSDASIYDYARQWRRIISDDWNKIHSGSGINEDPIEDNCRFLIQSGFLFENITDVHKLLQTIWGFKWDQTDFYGVDGSHAVAGETVTRKGFDIVVFDTLSKMTRADQNNNSAMEEVFRNIRLITEVTGATVILLHHNSKRTEFNSGEDWRGAVAQIGALDCWLQLTPGRTDKYTITAEMKKFRGITPEPFTYHMDVGTQGPAKLEYHKEPGTVAFSDAFSHDVGEFIVGAYPKSVTVVDISSALWDKHKESVGGDIARLRKKIKNRLRDDSLTHNGIKIVQLPRAGKTEASQYVSMKGKITLEGLG